MAKPVTFKWTNEYGDEIEPDSFESYEGFNYDEFMNELGLED